MPASTAAFTPRLTVDETADLTWDKPLMIGAVPSSSTEATSRRESDQLTNIHRTLARWYPWRDSNPHHPDPNSGALAVELHGTGGPDGTRTRDPRLDKPVL